jgi:sugar O-acyltransferase (sialic acid O-acetyltransferase NeuD family)
MAHTENAVSAAGRTRRRPQPPDLILLGAGGGVYDVLDIVDALNDDGANINLLGVLDDGREPGSEHVGLEVIGGLADCHRFASARFVSTIHNERDYSRHPEIIARLGLAPERFATLIHPRAGVSRRATIGHGVCICDGASVAGGVTIGDHAFLGARAVVGHNTTVEDHVVLAAGALLGGVVHAQRACYVGSAAAVRPNVTIGREALVGLGAIVVRDVPESFVVVGNPARRFTGQDDRGRRHLQSL